MTKCPRSIFDDYIKCWQLQVNGEIITTHSSCLMPVLYQNQKAMLKIAISPEEQQGISALLWWDGHGAVPILKHNEKAVLMKHATENDSLVDMVDRDQDDDATRIICLVVKKLHAYKSENTCFSGIGCFYKWLQFWNTGLSKSKCRLLID